MSEVFQRGFLRKPAVIRLLDQERQEERDEERARIAMNNEEIYLRAIRRWFDATEGMK